MDKTKAIIAYNDHSTILYRVTILPRAIGISMSILLLAMGIEQKFYKTKFGIVVQIYLKIEIVNKQDHNAP